MWDWELLKNGSGTHTYTKLAHYSDENFQYAHVITEGTIEDVFCLHNHAMYELVYHISGDVVYLAEGEKYALEPHSLLIIAPTVPHKLFICSDKPFERHALYIYYSGNDSSLSSMMAQCLPPIGQNRVGSMYYRAEDIKPLGESLDQLAKSSMEKDEALKRLPPIFAEGFAARLLMIARSIAPTQQSHGISTTADTMLAYLKQCFTRDITLREIADRFHISKDYCNRVFRRAVGMTVMQYVMYNRILYAKSMLLDGVPAAQAAERAGFSDYSNFYRAYKNITGHSPKADHRLSEGEVETADCVWREVNVPH